VIADLKGLGLRQFYMPAVWLLKDLVFVAEQNYPCVPASLSLSLATPLSRP
jgi:hypothetical protein